MTAPVLIPMTPSRIYSADLLDEARSTLAPLGSTTQLAIGLTQAASIKDADFSLDDMMSALMMDGDGHATDIWDITVASRALRAQCAPLAYRLSGSSDIRRSAYVATSQCADTFVYPDVTFTYLRFGVLMMIGSKIAYHTRHISKKRGSAGFDPDVVQAAFKISASRYLSNHERLTFAHEVQSIIASRLRLQPPAADTDQPFPEILVAP
jgi:hypothetical protein